MDRQKTELEPLVSKGDVNADNNPKAKPKKSDDKKTEIEKLVEAGVFTRIKASELSLKDKFMTYNSESNEVYRELKKLIKQGGLKDFYCQTIDPSFNDENSPNKAQFCFERGKMPAVGKSYVWWSYQANLFMPKCHLGTREQYMAFIGVLVKKLVDEKGWTQKNAWNAVGKDSRKIGHYSDSPKAARNKFEKTGSRELCGFADLANTYKILQDNLFASGYYADSGLDTPVGRVEDEGVVQLELERFFGVGWIVVDE